MVVKKQTMIKSPKIPSLFLLQFHKLTTSVNLRNMLFKEEIRLSLNTWRFMIGYEK